MSKDLKTLTDFEIAGLMNDVVSVFDKNFTGRGTSGMTLKIGFLSLSREVSRRGLKPDKDRFGKIVLIPKN